MHRVIVCLLAVCLCGAGARADCAQEVVAAWKRLHASPFHFNTKVFSAADEPAEWVGTMEWPRALRYGYPNGEFEHLFIGSHQWIVDAARRWIGGTARRPLTSSSAS